MKDRRFNAQPPCAEHCEKVRAVAPGQEGECAGRVECRWKREQLPDVIRELVLDDQRVRNEICWSVFEC
jgi:hypothetical protein